MATYANLLVDTRQQLGEAVSIIDKCLLGFSMGRRYLLSMHGG
ncbi:MULTISPECIES: hypothetical protein [Fervidicoccus]|nr:hypothetical protein [Fervidicoccus fontis]